MKPTIHVIGTFDTKGRELVYIAGCIRESGAEARLVDVGTGGPPQEQPDVAREQVADFHPDGREAVLSRTDRGEAVTGKARACSAHSAKKRSVAALMR
jgi:uncharacterized protein (UPF0261 family)